MEVVHSAHAVLFARRPRHGCGDRQCVMVITAVKLAVTMQGVSALTSNDRVVQHGLQLLVPF
jgi:hypothetical protein